MRYREIPPASSFLAPYIRFFWTLESGLPLPPQIVIPDGCPELIVHSGDPFSLSGQTQPRTFVFGQIERAIVLEPGLRASVLGVRFRPAGLAAFTTVPQSELRGRMVECRDLWKDFTLPEQPGPAALERFLLRQLRPRPEPWRESLSGRQNRRRFADAVGLSPKRLERIRRLQTAMSMLGRVELARAANEAGYFDQAHFTRDFREFTGQTPAQYLREPHALSDLFIHGADVRNVQDSAEAPARH